MLANEPARPEDAALTKTLPPVSPAEPLPAPAAYTFARLSGIAPEVVLAHLREPRIARHLPLLPEHPTLALARQLIAAKEACWDRDGLGHWAILANGRYAGWGGFQREGEDWDFGLVLRPEHFRGGRAIALQALAWARARTAIAEVTFLLPRSRSRRSLERLGARMTGESEHDGVSFARWVLDLRESGAARDGGVVPAAGIEPAT